MNLNSSSQELIFLWSECVKELRLRYSYSEEILHTWINPLRVTMEGNIFYLIAPNKFIKDWILRNYYKDLSLVIKNVFKDVSSVEIFDAADFSSKNSALLRRWQSNFYDDREINKQQTCTLPDSKKQKDDDLLKISKSRHIIWNYKNNINTKKSLELGKDNANVEAEFLISKIPRNNLIKNLTFDNFVQGNSNKLACSAALQVAENPGFSYNPLFIYGDVGLGKTHLMHAVGNAILSSKSESNIVYLHSEKFVADMVKALQSNVIEDFKNAYRAVDALLIDDIQFLAGKERSQEEFFHTFNSLFEGHQQIILTCDRYPNNICGIEERLKSRFGWGLTVAIEPPDLETRVAILINKADALGLTIDYDVAAFIAKKIKSNVRELEGILKRVAANSEFNDKVITIDFIQETLKDLFSTENKLVKIADIQRVVSDHFRLHVNDLLSGKRDRAIVRPRQLAMSLAKELTTHSLIEIGKFFGRKDHTTVIHACKVIDELRKNDLEFDKVFDKLLLILSTE